MDRGNVLVIGNSGVGKSTLINAVLGDEVAFTDWGTSGTTKKLDIYESDSIPFRIIDSVGFEPSFVKSRAAINAVKKWSRNSATEGHENSKINVIWFCVDGTSSKLFPQTIKDLSRATDMWKSVPVIVVITKSYSTPERETNIQMVHNAFSTQKRYSKSLRAVIPVVASTFTLNESAFAAPDGLNELIDATNSVMPEGIKAGAQDVIDFKNKRKKAIAQSIVGSSTVAATTVGAVPIPFPDAAILVPIEIAEITAIAHLYEIKDSEDSKRFVSSIVEAGTAGMAAKAAINALKAIPGINLAAAVLNAAIAGSFVAAIGEGSIYAFEKIYKGEKSITDVEWVTKLIEDKLSSEFIEKVTTVIKQVSENGDVKDIGKFITKIIEAAFIPPADKKLPKL